jgi:hypothetical protein
MKWFVIELPFGPSGHVSDHIALSNKRPYRSRTVCRLWKLVGKVNIAANADEKNSSTILSDPEISGIEYRPRYSVSSQSITIDLIQKKIVIITKGHPIDVLDNERSGSYSAKDTIKLTIEVIGIRIPLATARLTVGLARIATHQQFGLGKCIELCDVADLYVSVLNIRFIDFRSD